MLVSSNVFGFAINNNLTIVYQFCNFNPFRIYLFNKRQIVTFVNKLLHKKITIAGLNQINFKVNSTLYKLFKIKQDSF